MLPAASVPLDARQRYLRAAVAERRNDLDEAEVQYRWVTRLDGDRPWSWLALGRFVERQRRWSDALVAYSHAVERGPSLAEAHLALGSCLARSGDMTAGIPSLQRAWDLGSADGAHLTIRALLTTGQRDAAQAALDRWLAGPVPASSRTDRAFLSYELSRYDAAVDDLLAVDWTTAPPLAGAMFVDAAQRSCRLGDVWRTAHGNAFASRTDPGWTRVAREVAELVGDDALFRAAGGDVDRDPLRPASTTKQCTPRLVEPGCEGLPSAWTNWLAAPLQTEAFDVLSDRNQACPDAADRYDLVAVRRWMTP